MADVQSGVDALREAADRFVGDLLDASDDTRAQRLADLHRDDPALAALVESLTAHLPALDDFLEEPLRIARVEDSVDALIGARLDHWKIVRQIGRGGMGLVFEVERDDGVVRQRAALKLIRRSFDDASIAARFRIERQILAGLDHPNIGRLIDAGATAEGRPYLVMELIDGVPLDAWCGGHTLAIEQRIALFATICSAVHYAHQRLVVHRDLKPTNILVTAEGTPKLLDFGISKLLHADDAAAARAETIDASTLLTPRYASPEQLTGAPISTASDVYSLGVLLFELLTGEMPYRTRNDSLIEMMRAVTTDEPTRASLAVGRDVSRNTIAKRLRGDLDHILQKALARDPADRYESAAALRDDLIRHLAGDPIRAVPPTWTYRAGKFVRKHRIAVGATAAVTVAIVGLSLFAAREAWRADRARDLAESQRVVAERRFEETRSLAKTMLFDLNDAIATGPTKAREQLVRTALTYLDRLSQDHLTPDLQRDVAGGYERIAQILGEGSVNNLGRADEAKQYLLKALALRERLAQNEPDNVDNLVGLVSANVHLGQTTRFDGAPEEAARYFAEATRYALAKAALRPDDYKAALDVFGRRRDEAVIRYVPGRPSLKQFDDAMRRYLALLADIDAYAAAHPGTPRITLYQTTVLTDITVLAQISGNAQLALDTSRRDLDMSEKDAREQPDNPEIQRGIALTLRGVGDALIELGRTDEGYAQLQRSQAIRTRLYANDPTSVLAARDLAIGNAMLGYAYDLSGRPREALAEYESWARRADDAVHKDPSNKGHKLDLEQARWSIAEMHLALDQSAVALSEARRVEAEILAYAGAAPDDEAAREALGRSRLIAARALVALGSKEDTFALARLGLQGLAVNEERAPENAFAARDADRARIQAGVIGIGSMRDRVEGCALVAEGRNKLRTLAAQKRLTVQFRPVLDQADAAMKRCTQPG